MNISSREVRQIAELARLELSDEEIERFARDLGTILTHVDALKAVDTEDVAPMGGVTEHVAPFREDEIGADPLEVPIDEFAPAFEEGFFIVPRLAALDADAMEGGSA